MGGVLKRSQPSCYKGHSVAPFARATLYTIRVSLMRVSLFCWSGTDASGRIVGPPLPYKRLQTALLWTVLSGGARDHKQDCRCSASQLVRRAITLYCLT